MSRSVIVGLRGTAVAISLAAGIPSLILAVLAGCGVLSSKSIWPAAGTAAAATAAVVWLWIDLKLGGRLRGLADVSWGLLSGDRSARDRLPVGPDEIGRIAGAFKDMADLLDMHERRSRASREALSRSEEKLRHVQRLQAMGQLAGGIAHDFNNLLTVISGYAEMLRNEIDAADPRRAHVAEITKASERAAGLTRQLLAFSRRQVLRPRVIDVNAVVAEMEKMLRRVVGEDVRLDVRLDPSLWRVRADPGQLEQVIMNLVVNARDSMPEGGDLVVATSNVTLDERYVREHPDAKAGPHVCLAVSDTGVGMDAQTMSRLFEPFFTTKEPGKGTGLGLATVYGIVEQSGGSIGVQSELGKGSTFRVFLPRVDDEIEEPKRPSASAMPAVCGSETVLVVEDSDVVRNLVREVLVSKGFRILEARTGREAVQVCENFNGQIHLLLTDVVMPEAGGRDLAEYIKTLQPDMKVLYMSGYAETAVFKGRRLDEKIEFIPKPFTPAQLVRKVREVIDGTA